MNVHMSRRGFIFGAAAFSIVRPEILMPIKGIELPEFVPCPGPMWNLVEDRRINEILWANPSLLGEGFTHHRRHGVTT